MVRLASRKAQELRRRRATCARGTNLKLSFARSSQRSPLVAASHTLAPPAITHSPCCRAKLGVSITHALSVTHASTLHNKDRGRDSKRRHEDQGNKGRKEGKREEGGAISEFEGEERAVERRTGYSA
eukprot:1995936-Rhodomonas_salina.1